MLAESDQTRRLGADKDGFFEAESGARFRLEGLLGHGGFGYVFRARYRLTAAHGDDDRSLESALALIRDVARGELWVPCAVKFIIPQLGNQQWEAFSRESFAWLSCAVPHPHIIRAYGLEFSLAGMPFLQLELARRGDLASRIAHGPLSAYSATRMLAQVASALVHAAKWFSSWGLGRFSHGDLKPANILLGDSPLTDCWCDSCVADLVHSRLRNTSADVIREALFGLPRPRVPIAKLSDFGMAALGTEALQGCSPAYVAPEQLDGQRCPANDVYALGVIAFELYTQQLPFWNPDENRPWDHNAHPAVLVDLHRRARPRDLGHVCPSLPSQLAELVCSCLEKRAEDRPTIEEVHSQLESVARSLSAPSDFPSPTMVHRGEGNPTPGAKYRVGRSVECLTSFGTVEHLTAAETIQRRRLDGTDYYEDEWPHTWMMGLDTALAYQTAIARAQPVQIEEGAYFPFYLNHGVEGLARGEWAVPIPPFWVHSLAWRVLSSLRSEDVRGAVVAVGEMAERWHLVAAHWRARLEGLVSLAQGHVDEAVGHFSASLEAYPMDGITRSNLAVALWRQGACSSALEHAARAAADAAAHGDVVANWLRISHLMDAWDARAKQVKQSGLRGLRYAVEPHLGEDPEPVLRWDVHPPLLWDLDDPWQTMEVIRELQRIVSRELECEVVARPNDCVLLFQIAALAAASGEFSKARRYLQRLTRISAADPETMEGVAAVERYLDKAQLCENP